MSNITVKLVEKNGSVDRAATLKSAEEALDRLISESSEGLESATSAASSVCQAHSDRRLGQDYIVNHALVEMNVGADDYNRYSALVRRALKNTDVFSTRRGSKGGTTLVSLAASIDAE